MLDLRKAVPTCSCRSLNRVRIRISASEVVARRGRRFKSSSEGCIYSGADHTIHREMVIWRLRRLHSSRSALSASWSCSNSSVARRCHRRQIKPIGFDYGAFWSAMSPAFTIWAVFKRDQSDFGESASMAFEG